MSFLSKTITEFSEWLRCNNFSDQVIDTLKGIPSILLCINCGLQLIRNEHYLQITEVFN